MSVIDVARKISTPNELGAPTGAELGASTDVSVGMEAGDDEGAEVGDRVVTGPLWEGT